MRRAKYLNNDARYKGGVKTNILDTAIFCEAAFKHKWLRSAV